MNFPIYSFDNINLKKIMGVPETNATDLPPKQSIIWRLGKFLAALICTITIIPLIVNTRLVKALWISSLTGIDETMRQSIQKTNNAAQVSGVFNSPSNSTDPAEISSMEAVADGFITKESCCFQSVSKEEVLALQQQMKNPNPKYALLSLEGLKDELFPQHKLQIGEACYYASKPFNIDLNRVGAVVLIKIKDKVVPRMLYRSQSQSIWRVMPAAQKNFPWKLGHFGKGIMESDTQVPAALNLALQSILPIINIPHGNENKVGLNLARLNIHTEPFDLIKTGWNYTETYRERVTVDAIASIPVGEPLWFQKKDQLIPRPPNPACIQLIGAEVSPNFKNPLYTQEFNDPMYGKLKATIFPSHDKSIQYTFYEAEDGRAFLAAAERVKNSLINGYGIRSKALDLKGMDAPLLEYWEQIPEDYETGDAPCYQSKQRQYANNWNYIHDLSIIQAYYKDQGREIPPKFEKKSGKEMVEPSKAI